MVPFLLPLLETRAFFFDTDSGNPVELLEVNVTYQIW